MFSKKKFSNQSGFTILEIVIVFAIIALLSTYMLGNVGMKSQQRSRDTTRKANLANIAKVLEIYFNDYGQYPASNVNGQIMGCGADGIEVCTWGGTWVDDNGTIYMSELPEEHRSNMQYFYNSSPTGWQLYAFLEASEDPAINGTSPDNDFPGTDCGNETCNYGISSGNTTPGGPLPL